MPGPLRVLPLGGLGEIGKNMTVVEYDGCIIVVDVGLRFPTAEQLGIDLVLPDFSYLRERFDYHGRLYLAAYNMGPRNVNRALAKRPPQSTEQVMHPEKYLAKERPLPVRIASPGRCRS